MRVATFPRERHAWLPCLALGLALLMPPAPARAQTLPDLWNAALARDPAVSGAVAQWRAAEERLVQARAAYGPTVTLTATYNDTRLREQPGDELRPLWARQTVLQLNQPLLRPQLGSQRRGAQAQADQAREQLEQARLESGVRLAEACFELFKARDAVAVSRAQQAATAEELAAAQRKYRVGTAPVTDLREAEAKADVVAAQLAAAEQQLQLRVQLLEEISGAPVQGLLQRGLQGGELPPLQPAALAQWLQEARDASPQVRQAQRGVEAAVAEVGKAQDAHLPTLDLTASKTRNADTGTVLTPQGRRYDAGVVGVNLNVPLFASGATQARVREALALRDKAQSELEAAQRAVAIGVRQQFSAAASAMAQASGFATAVKSGELSLRANRRGYEAGLRVMAEVLDAQSKLFDAQRELSRARYDAWLGMFRLQAHAGRLEEADFQRFETLLAPLAQDMPVQRQQRAR